MYPDKIHDLDSFFSALHDSGDATQTVKNMAAKGMRCTNIKQKESVAFFFSMLPSYTLHTAWTAMAKKYANGCTSIVPMMIMKRKAEKRATVVQGSTTVN